MENSMTQKVDERGKMCNKNLVDNMRKNASTMKECYRKKVENKKQYRTSRFASKMYINPN